MNTPHEITPEESNGGVTGSFGISSDRFEGVVATYQEATREAIRFWFYLGKERSWSLAKLANATGISTTSLSRLFRGVYGAGLDSVTEKLAKARENFSDAVANPDFIMTSLARRYFAAADKTRALANVTLIWGRMGIGKSTVMKEYHRQNNHGKTMTVRFPVGASFAHFVNVVAHATGVSVRSQSRYHQQDKIIATLSAGQRLLQVDELHQAFLTTRGDTAVRCSEFLREIKDEAGCGLLLVGTELMEKEFFHGRFKDSLAQLVDRGTVQIPLPSKPTKTDILAFLAHYDLAFPTEQDGKAVELLSDILESSGLRKLTMHLRDGAAYAAKVGEVYDWSHFVKAHAAIQSLSKKAV